MSITILDYGVGNMGSILNMLKRIDTPATITANPKDVAKAEKLILPGVGAFDPGMKKLKDFGFVDALNEAVFNRKVPILGICLGLQLFTQGSEEGNLEGLGWFEAKTAHFRLKPESKLKIPHMGWNSIRMACSTPLFSRLPSDPRFYFVHSFHVTGAKDADVIATSQYGYEFASAVEKHNIVGVQFHPEKSHKFGMQILRNFVELY